MNFIKLCQTSSISYLPTYLRSLALLSSSFYLIFSSCYLISLGAAVPSPIPWPRNCCPTSTFSMLLSILSPLSVLPAAVVFDVLNASIFWKMDRWHCLHHCTAGSSTSLMEIFFSLYFLLEKTLLVQSLDFFIQTNLVIVVIIVILSKSSSVWQSNTSQSD